MLKKRKISLFSVEVAYSSDSNQNKGFIQIWNPYTDVTLPTSFDTNGHTKSVRALKYINESALASGSDDNSIKIWDFNSGDCLLTIQADTHPTKVLSLERLSDRLLASGLENRKIRIWNIDNGALVKNLDAHQEKVNALEMLHNGDLASGSDDNKIKIWDLSTFTLKYSLDAGDKVNCLKQLLNGNLASGLKGSDIKIWNLVSKNLIATLDGHAKAVNDLEVLMNGDLASCSDDKEVKIWDANSYAFKYDLNGLNFDINAIKLLSNGHLAIGANWIRVVNVSTKTEIEKLHNNKAILSLELLGYLVFTTPKTTITTKISSSTMSINPLTSISITTTVIFLMLLYNTPKFNKAFN